MKLKVIEREFLGDWRLLVALLPIICLSIGFRTVNLGEKPFWENDEGYTLLRAAGYTVKEVNREIFPGKVIALSDFRKYLEPSPERGAIGTVIGLASEEPQHPPLYYWLIRFWQQQFGSSKLALRSLNIIFSLLTFPVIYWLCRELFALPLVGWLAMALYGVSPAMLKFATFVRPYSLLLLLSLLSSAIFLRSLKHSTKLGWMLYAATTAVGLYTHLLMGLVAIAHGIYLLLIEKLRLSELVKRYLLSAIAAGVMALPWLWIVWQSLPTVRETTKWLAQPIPALELIHWWAQNLNRGFAAWHFQYESIFFYAIAPLLVLVVWAIYVLIRRTPVRTWSFILALMGTSFLPFLLADLLLGGKRTTAQRFFLVGYVCLDIAIAYLLASHLAATIKERTHLQFWRFVTVLLLGVGAISGAAGAWGETWWGHSEFDKAIAPIVAQTSRPLVINFCDYCGFYDKVYFPLTFAPETHILFINDANSFFLPPGFSNIFLFMFSPSSKKTYLSKLEQQGIDYQLAYYFIDTSTQFEVALYRVNPRAN